MIEVGRLAHWHTWQSWYNYRPHCSSPSSDHLGLHYNSNKKPFCVSDEAEGSRSTPQVRLETGQSAVLLPVAKSGRSGGNKGKTGFYYEMESQHNSLLYLIVAELFYGIYFQFFCVHIMIKTIVKNNLGIIFPDDFKYLQFISC